MPSHRCPYPPSRREFLRAGVPALGGLTLPQPAGRPRRRAAGRPGHRRHPVLDVGRPQPPRDVRPQARRTRGVPGALPADHDRRARPGRLRAVPPPGPPRQEDRPSAVAAPHDGVAQRRLHRGADGQDAVQGRPHLDGAVGAPRLRHGGQQGARPAARRPAAVRRRPDPAVHDPPRLTLAWPTRRSRPATPRRRRTPRPA